MKVIFSILNFFFPISCFRCTKSDFFSKKIGVCRKCYQIQRFKKKFSACEVCQNIKNGDLCEFCESRNVFFDKLFFIREKNDFEREILNKIKFGNKIILSNIFRIGFPKVMNLVLKENINFVTVVPSHKKTIRKRPFHPTTPVYKKLLNRLKFSSRNISILKKDSTELQSGKTFTNRFLHARKSFQIQKKFTKKLFGNAVLLDDIFTTGATINECAKILKENGIQKVFVIVLAKKTSDEFRVDSK